MILFYVRPKVYKRQFVEQLRTVYQRRFLIYANRKRINQIEKQIELLYNKSDIRLFDICLQAISSAVLVENDDYYFYKVDSNFRVQGLCVSSILELINSGSLDIPAYPIFSQIENIIESDMNNLYQLYQYGVLI